jgi:hypothetical protein
MLDQLRSAVPRHPSHQFKAERAADDLGRALKRGESNVAVLRVKQTADLAAAGFHVLGKALAREILRFHRLADLPCQYLLDGDSLEFFELAFALEEVVKGGQVIGRARDLLLFISASSRIELTFASAGQRETIVRCFLRLLDEAVEKDDFARLNAEQDAGDPVVRQVASQFPPSSMGRHRGIPTGYLNHTP